MRDTGTGMATSIDLDAWTADERGHLAAGLTRRRLVGGVAAAAIAGHVRSAGAQTPAAGWTFTDDMGVTVTLAEMPRRIVASITVGAALMDFGIEPVGVIGPVVLPDGSRSPAAGNLDADRTRSITVDSATGPDLEEMLSLEPDLIVTSVLKPSEDAEPGPAGFLPETLATVLEIAPILAFDNTAVSVRSIIGRIEDLALALDGPAAGDLDALRSTFEAAEAAVRDAIAAKPDLTAMAIAGTDQNFFVLNPDTWADLRYLQELGLAIVKPESADWYWQTLTWEEASLYQADLLLNDPTWYSIDQLSAQPTLQSQPAIVAGQVTDRPIRAVWSYQGYTPVLEAWLPIFEDVDASLV